MSIINLPRTRGVMSDHRSRECGLCGPVLARVIVASFFLFSFFTGNVMAGAGSENFEGPYADRTFRVINYSSGNPIGQSLKFPSFDPLLGNGSAQGLQFNEYYIPNSSKTSDFAQIRRDPLNPSNHVLWLRAICCKTGSGKTRNELHYSYPYGNANQPNGTKYTFAFRFYTPTTIPGSNTIIMQGYSEYPFLRVGSNGTGTLSLQLVMCGKTPAECAAGIAKGDYSVFTFGRAELGSYKVGSWNTVVLNVSHDNRSYSGFINAYLNGVKKTYSGRTTYRPGGTTIPWLKAGPYGGTDTTIYYDDVYWQPGFVNPYASVP